MPLTPFHLAVGLPLRKRISLKAFILVNVLIDLEPAAVMFFGMDKMGYALHQGVHTLGGATLMAFVAFLCGMACKGKWRPWLSGTVVGAYSHPFLDALVHSDVAPFSPFFSGNPLFLDIHLEVTIACGVILSYYLTKWIESLRIEERWAARTKGGSGR